MATEVQVPVLGESVTEATVGAWLKKPGDAVAVDEPIASLETDKVAVDVPSPVAGVMGQHMVSEGDTVNVGAVIAIVEEGATAAAKPAAAAAPAAAAVASGPQRAEERVKMTRLRQTVAKRLKSAQETAALLTTFNDVDMSAVIEARARYKDLFEKKHGVRLGFMGFFTKAVCMALRDVPAVNAQIEGDEIVYHNYADISVAVSAPNGLVVPVIRNAEEMSVAEIEKTIGDFGKRAKEGALTMEDMKGGTFTISNGGVFGSLMSTPIINPPQSAVLGLHRIEDRPVVRNGQVVVRPMMYLALSYDHRLIDGREAVTFLVAIKNAIEDPTRLLIDL
ncbi:dihydrolipoyllysine-residue succinyltransferase component of 2-oxoglutarate dehydrogenase complex [Sphingobium jiangsuense]|uniref:2-oxoglutarate dehydrogenase complex dihydrolipoyllysine-residue succinyltransferase n=1 Tax=Sphingobium jiangsuense TaxID=870476 RepID=UPI00235C9169|nr:2-oxoglutarate dehydrogenase complex dihydrolipoyllysine-residue succinyltransferase [Sphingobium jiangsuense]GLS98734.1 dihydrolipoyllysine-residue succinyltransferase component of 2-oxoglutarate dehydrogenase complex [Sphingobium jiangsuense]